MSDGAEAGRRIKKIIDGRGWSLRKLAEMSGVDKGHLSVMLRGGVPNPGAGTLGKISDALRVPLSELTGEKPMPTRQAVVTKGVVVVPVMKLRVQADGHPTWDDTTDNVTTLAELAGRRPDRLRAARVSGDCMSPDANDGDTVIFDPERTQPVDGQMVVALTADGSMLVKWFRVDELGRRYLRANDDTVIRLNGTKVIGTVIDINRRPGRDPQVGQQRRSPRDTAP